MTIIAYKDGECWADDLVFKEDLIIGRELKIAYRKKDGAIIAASGGASACSEFLKWGVSGRGKPPAIFHDERGAVNEAIVITADGEIHDYSGPEPTKPGADFYAIGSGANIALGAMMVGASAKEAVMAACSANGWPASLHGVNHLGEWSELSIEEVFKPVHGSRTPTVPADHLRRGRRGR